MANFQTIYISFYPKCKLIKQEHFKSIGFQKLDLISKYFSIFSPTIPPASHPRHVQPVLITCVKQSSSLSNSFHTTKYSSPGSWPQRRLAWGQLRTSGTHTLKLHRVRKTQMKTIKTDKEQNMMNNQETNFNIRRY